MGVEPRPLVSVERSFDVVCAGEALWEIVSRGLSPDARSPRFRPGGGAVEAALSLAARGFRVGLATILTDDAVGRALAARLEAAGVDLGGVVFAPPGHRLVLVEGDGGPGPVGEPSAGWAVAVPEGWSSQVLLLSGVTPDVAQGAALCKAARSARRAGARVVVDVNVRWHLWQGRDPRIIRMLLREADVVWCSAEDRFGLNMDVASMQAVLRPTAVLALTDGAGHVSAIGPFGEVAPRPSESASLPPIGEGSAFTAAICAELVRSSGSADSGALFARALEAGRKAASARLARRAPRRARF